MKRVIRSSLLVIAAVAVAVTTLHAAPKKWGTDILHFFVRKAMHDEGVETGATGRVNAKQNRQGKANNQTLNIYVSGLSSNTTYQLFALIDDDTNYTYVADFDTGARGRAALQYRKKGNGNGNGGGLGNGRNSLPPELDPISQVREVIVVNSATQVVMTADLTVPDKLQYLIKRNLSTDTVDALLRIKATTAQTHFRLIAEQLAATNDYLLVLNGSIVQTNSTDANGKLEISSLLEVPTEILDLRTVALWDTSSNVVVSTELP